MSAKHRWSCPECGNVVLLGARPRRDATARFCLACSERSGTLVERVCPVLDKQRAQKRDSREQKRKRKADRERDAETVSGVHIPSELRNMCRKLVKARVFPRWMRYTDRITLDLKIYHVTRSKPRGVTDERWQQWVDQTEVKRWHGRAYLTLIELCFGCRVPRWKVLALLFHELCHLAAPRKEGHDDHFTTILAEGARELWGIKLETIHTETYDLDRELEKKLEEHLA